MNAETRLHLHPSKRNESGVILITVLIFLLAILALALPLALMSQRVEKENASRLDNSVARMYANMALNHTKQRLRLGIYENEYKYLYGKPTASPTPTPSTIADLSPYDTPLFDGPAEIFFDREELNIIADNAPTSNGDIPTLGIKVEDEQGKLNINSLTPDILLGLFLETQSIDPKELSESDLKDLLDFRDIVIEKIALKRASSGHHYSPVKNVSDLINLHDIDGSDYFGFNESQFESMARFLTAHSWRLYSKGFPEYTTVKVPITDELPGEIVAIALGRQLHKVFILDIDDKVLSMRYMYPKKEGKIWVFTIEDVPEEAAYYAYCIEDFHSININTCSPELLTGMIMSRLDFDDLKWSLAEAREITRLILPRLEASSITESDGTYKVVLDENCEYNYLPSGGWFSIGGMYVSASRAENILTINNSDVGEILIETPFPTQCSVLYPSIQHVRSRIRYFATNTDLRTATDRLFKPQSVLENDSTRLFTTVSFDIYKITCSCRVTTPIGLTSSTWQISEIVELGKGEALSNSSERIDTLTDFTRVDSSANYLSANSLRKSRVSANGTNSKGLPFAATFPPPNYPPYAEENNTSHVISFSYTDNMQITNASKFVFSNGVGTASSNAAQADSLKSFLFNPENFKASPVSSSDAGHSKIASRLLFGFGKYSTFSPRVGFISNPPTNYHSCGNFGVSIWVMAKGWDPATERGRKYIFSLRPTDSANAKGATTLYVENGLLVLSVKDDIGNCGQLNYPLINRVFPADTWINVAAHVQGNKEGQMALLLDGRLVNADYTSSHDRGYCLKSATSIARTKPKLTLAASSSDTTITVDSTSDFPNSGYLRIEDEIIYYASKTDTTFDGLERGIGASKDKKHAISTEITQAIWLEKKPITSEMPQKNDKIEILSFSNPISYSVSSDALTASAMVYTRESETEKFTLDMAIIEDSARNTWIVPFPKGFAFSALSTLNARSYLMYGTTGTSTSGDAKDPSATNTIGTNLDVCFLSPPDTETGFPGFVQDAEYHKSPYVCFQLTEDLKDNATVIDKSEISFGVSEGSTYLVKVGGEVIGFRLYYDEFILTRGMLGTTAEEHKAGTWAIPLTMLEVNPIPVDLTATTKKLELDAQIPDLRKVVRIGDEIVFFKYIGEREVGTDKKFVYHLIRGFLGSTVSTHSEYDLMIPLPLMNYAAYEFNDDPQITDDYLEFFIHRAGERYLGLTWRTQEQNGYINTHAWFSTEQGGSFNPIQNSKNMFVFDDDSTNFEISRSGANQYVMSDEATIRIAYEYKKGAWDPNNLTRHGWKSLPYLDTIEIWCESADVVYYHSECP